VDFKGGEPLRRDTQSDYGNTIAERTRFIIVPLPIEILAAEKSILGLGFAVPETSDAGGIDEILDLRLRCDLDCLVSDLGVEQASLRIVVGESFGTDAQGCSFDRPSPALKTAIGSFLPSIGVSGDFFAEYKIFQEPRAAIAREF
jgi:hypothetical protein